MQNYFILPSLKHSDIFVQCLNMYWVNLGNAALFFGCKIIKFRRHVFHKLKSTYINIAQKYLSALKMEEGCGFACEALKVV